MKQNNEINRLKALLSYEILDTPSDAYFDEFARLVSLICNTPIALVSFIDNERQWFKAKVGIDTAEMPNEVTICQYTLVHEDVLEINDTFLDNRLDNNPNVHTENGIRFYAGIPLTSPDGYAIGTVCAADTVPRTLNEEQKNAIRIIARQIMQHMDAQQKNKVLCNELQQVLDQKIAEASKKIELKEDAYNNLFNAIAASNAVIEFAPDGTILSANQQFLDILGYSQQELIGSKHQQIISKEELTSNNHFWQSLRQGKCKSGRFRRMHKNGTPVWIQASYNPVKDEDGKVIRVTKIAQNITTEIAAQKDLEKAKLLSDELNVQKDNFIANMSHEIRTPINSIIGFTDLLLDVEKDPEKYRYLQSVKTASNTLLYLINDILDLSKIESGNIQIDQAKFNLASVIENTFSVLNIKAAQKKLRFTYTIDKDVEENLVGDKNRLSQVLINLLGNAIKFTHKGGVNMYVSVKENVAGKQTLQFKIKDTGIGIPDHQTEAIFDRFKQAEESITKNYGGTGLGLNITKQLLHLQNGTIDVKSTLGKGSEFTMTIPYQVQPQQPAEAFSVKQHEQFKNGTGRILMCEDNIMNQNLAKAIFKKTGYLLDIAENGLEGIELLQKNRYDLVLMDVQMPEMDGYQATLAIRQQLKLDVPIIAITAHCMVKEKAKCLSLGMNDYLPKPFKREELFEKINYWIKGFEIVAENKVTTNKNSNVICLKHLEELSGGDKQFQQEMLQLFQQQSKENLNLILENYGENNFKEASKIAHKLKSSFGIVGANISLLSELENDFDAAIASDIINSKLNLFQKQIQEINKEIKIQLQ